MMMDFHFLFTPPAYAKHYRREQLDLADKEKLKNTQDLEMSASWRNSRALKQRCREQFPEQAFCLSHKHDHALIAVGARKPGSDLEHQERRDYRSLIAQVGSSEEIDHIAGLADPQENFYRLWTLKESLIKAENLRFPKDMGAVGIARFTPRWELRGKTEQAYAWVSAKVNETWLIAGVWPQSEAHVERKARLIIHAPKDFPVFLQDVISNYDDLRWTRDDLSR